MKPETLRLYADIFELRRRDPVNSQMLPAPSICMEMAQCARIVADAIERDDPNLPPGWRNVPKVEHVTCEYCGLDVTSKSCCGLAAITVSGKCAVVKMKESK